MSILSIIQNNKLLTNDYLKYILLKISTKKGASYSIFTATILTLLYTIHKKISQPPPQLRHLPHVNFYTYMKAAFSDMSVNQYTKNIISPLMKDSPGAFVQPSIGFWSVQLTDPIATKQLLLKSDIYPKSDLNRGLPGTLIHRYIGGDSILTLNGSDWKRHRKIANKAFNQSMPIKLFGELTLQMFDTIDNLGSTVEVADLFQRLTIDVIGLASFGFHFNSLVDRDNKWVSYYNSVKEGMLHPFFVVFPLFDSTLLRFFPKRQKIHDNLTEFTNMMDTIIEDKRKQLLAEKLDQDTVKDQSERDLLTLMLESENDEQVVLSNEELRNNLCIFFLAGHDTTSFSLSFMIYELAKNQDLQEKARKEALEILGNDHRDNLPTAEQTKNMTFINAVMKETMRLHPAVNTTTVREVTEDCHLGEIFIPKGTQVASDIINLHHCGKLWRNPHEFNPDRFLPGGEYEQHASSGLTWIPFSAGGRICVGMNFSLAEQRVVLSMLLKKYTWKLPKDSIHTNELIKNGMVFGMSSVKDLNIIFEKRY